MQTIHLTTFIEAPAARVFDLSRSVTLHKRSMENTGEEIVGTVSAGLMGLDETITWRGKHLGRKRIFKSRIVEFDAPHSFADEMQEGDFRYFRHEHYFKEVDNGTILIDLVHFKVPYGSAGKLFSRLYLTNYLRRLLEIRNNVIKEYAESSKWQHVLA